MVLYISGKGINATVGAVGSGAVSTLWSRHRRLYLGQYMVGLSKATSKLCNA